MSLHKTLSLELKKTIEWLEHELKNSKNTLQKEFNFESALNNNGPNIIKKEIQLKKWKEIEFDYMSSVNFNNFINAIQNKLTKMSEQTTQVPTLFNSNLLEITITSWKQEAYSELVTLGHNNKDRVSFCRLLAMTRYYST